MKSFHIKKEIIDNTLASASSAGKKLLEPLLSFAKENNLPINILETVNTAAEAEIHKNDSDLFGCLEGEIKFICGGELVNQWKKQNSDGSFDENELKAKEIKNGSEIILKSGDWLYIPAGEPHQHISQGVCRLFIIKIPKAEKNSNS